MYAPIISVSTRVRLFILSFSFITVIAFSVLSLQSCGGGSEEAVQNLSAQERYAQGVKKFNDGDYMEAINDFKIIKLQFPGTNVGDSAEYDLAQCYFKREEFLSSSAEFETLRRNYPTSILDTIALYDVALCYYRLAPKAALDQKYSLLAIDQFQGFIEYYPTNPLAKDAAAKITELNDRLALKDLTTAELYMRLEYYRAATHYYDNVIEKYHDTQYAEPAQVGKIHSLISRKKYDDAKQDIEKFLIKYPASTYKSEVEGMQKQIADAEAIKNAATHTDASASNKGG
ncbi:MAG TPA: outer membrane protein assembly factor BamD [Bacteroidota bacterium]|nr:outer membrane protein assembly factor BamD [Bacteroidota bacterium]